MDNLNELNSVLDGQVLQDELLGQYCQSGTGGYAKYLFIAEDIEALILAVATCQNIKLPYRIIGKGGGILFSDNGYDGLIIINKSSRIFTIPETNIISCDSGVGISQLINFGAERGLSGIESFSKIFGSIGGAIYNNAYSGTSICDFLHTVTLLTDKGKIITKSPDWLNCEIRSTRLSQQPKNKPWTILVASFRFQRRRPENIQEEIMQHKDFINDKNSNNLYDIFLDSDTVKAKDIIKKSGADKLRVGKVTPIAGRVNSIRVNKGATSSDIRNLIEQMREKVLIKSDIQLIESIEYFGLWH